MVIIQPVSCFHKNISNNHMEYNYIVIKEDGSAGICSKNELSRTVSSNNVKNLPELVIAPKAMRELVEQYMFLRYFISLSLRSKYNIEKKEKEHNIKK